MRLITRLAVLVATFGLAFAPVQVPAPAVVQVQVAQASDVAYPCGGWIPPNAICQQEHPDQGKDLVTGWRGIVQAPGSGCVVAIGHDRPFPSGFGPSYPWVAITAGNFAGHTYYLGHTTALVHDGQCFRFGAPLARADQGRPGDICPDLSACEGYPLTVNGGWVELGEVVDDGNGGVILGPNNGAAGHWYDALLRAPLVILDPYDLYPTTVFSLRFDERASEYNTVRTWDLAGCENPVRRVVCKGTIYHMRLLRDRDLWIAKHQLVDGHWTNRTRPDYVTNKIGARIQGLQHRITAPPGRRCSVARCQ